MTLTLEFQPSSETSAYNFLLSQRGEQSFQNWYSDVLTRRPSLSRGQGASLSKRKFDQVLFRQIFADLGNYTEDEIMWLYNSVRREDDGVDDRAVFEILLLLAAGSGEKARDHVPTLVNYWFKTLSHVREYLIPTPDPISDGHNGKAGDTSRGNSPINEPEDADMHSANFMAKSVLAGIRWAQVVKLMSILGVCRYDLEAAQQHVKKDMHSSCMIHVFDAHSWYLTQEGFNGVLNHVLANPKSDTEISTVVRAPPKFSAKTCIIL